VLTWNLKLDNIGVKSITSIVATVDVREDVASTKQVTLGECGSISCVWTRAACLLLLGVE
jgi:hypothetical protein